MPFTFSVIVLTAANVGCQCVTWLQTMMKVAVALEVTSPSPPQKAMSTAYNWQMGEHLRTRHLSLLFAPHKILACMTQRTRQIKFTVAKSRLCEHDVRELFHQKGQCTAHVGAGAGAGTGTRAAVVTTRFRVRNTSFTAAGDASGSIGTGAGAGGS